MNAHSAQDLFEGASPTIEDFGFFVSVVEKLPTPLLWTLLTSYPNMHHMLLGAAQQVLQSRVQRENVDEHLNSIATRLQLRRASED